MLAVLDHVRTVFGVHHDPASRGQEAENRIARYRPAATRIGHHHTLGAVDGKRRTFVARRPALEDTQKPAFLFDIGSNRRRRELPRHHAGEPVAEADFAEQIVPGFELEGFQQCLAAVLGHL